MICKNLLSLYLKSVSICYPTLMAGTISSYLLPKTYVSTSYHALFPACFNKTPKLIKPSIINKHINFQIQFSYSAEYIFSGFWFF